MTVTVKSVKERELPDADDDFAQLASEFDTLAELRENLTEQVSRVKRVHQAEQIRDNTLETLLELVEVPLPEAIVQAQVDSAVHNAIHPLDHDEDKFAESLEAQGSSREQFDTENREAAEKAVKTQLLMDAIAEELDIQVGQNDLTERLVLMSRQYGLEPQQLLQLLQQKNQLPGVFADVRRGLAVAAVVEAATVTDTDGKEIDTAEFFGSPAGESDESDEQSGRRRRVTPTAKDRRADIGVGAGLVRVRENVRSGDELTTFEKVTRKQASRDSHAFRHGWAEPHRLGLRAVARRAHHLPRLTGRRRYRQPALRADSAAWPPRIRPRTSRSTSTRRAARSAPVWRSTTPWFWHPAMSPPTPWVWPRRWGSSCWRPAPRASATHCRTPGS